MGLRGTQLAGSISYTLVNEASLDGYTYWKKHNEVCAMSEKSQGSSDNEMDVEMAYLTMRMRC
jgi:hypothetical protein